MRINVVPIRVLARWVFVPADNIAEFLPSTPWLAVPGSTPLMPGVMTWRGRAIPVLDLARALNLGSICPQDECARIMVLEHAVGAVAVPVGGAREVTSLVDDDIHPQHVSETPYTGGEAEAAHGVLPLINIDQLLHDVGKANQQP